MKMSTRTGALSGMIAGLAYLIETIIGLVKPQSEVFGGTSDYVLEAVFVVALLATIFALVGLNSLAQNHNSKIWTTGFWLTVIGTGLTATSAIVTLFAGKNSLGLAFLGGVLFSLIGYIVLGISTLRAKILPAWGGLALIFGFPLSVFLSNFGGGILFGLAWLGIGYFLLNQSSSEEHKAVARSI